MTIEELIAEIAKNAKGEMDAIEYYFKLLSSIKLNNLPKELYSQVQEIISDELNHSEVLTKWIVKLSGIKPNET